MNILTAKVQMLGGFQMTLGDITITDHAHQSKKPWSILEYLITYHYRDISASELIDLIWSDNQIRNPGSALKTLIFRTRKLLEPFGIPTQSLILKKSGAYSWSPKIELVIDTDLFEDYLKKANQPDISEDERLHVLMQALELYRGDFLPKSSCDAWVIPISTYYHSQFLQAAHQTIELLTSREQWNQIISLCRKAIEIEPFDDDFHYALIFSLYHNGEQTKALEHYQHTTNLFYNEFAITPSERFKDLYKLIQDKRRGIIMDLSIIQDSMQEEQSKRGAFLCEYSVFRDLYQLERRSIERTGNSIFLCLLTVCDEDGDLPKSFITTRAMTHLSTAIADSLRQGDVYTRYSISQYMIMLPTTSYENGELILQRIIRNFKKIYVRKELTVHYSLQAIIPESLS